MNEKLFREQCFGIVYRRYRGEIYERGERYFAEKGLVVLTPLGEIVENGRNPAEVLKEISRIRFVGAENPE